MKIPCVYMRGGTSKGVMFLEKDLPEDKRLWDNIFLKVMGGPDPKQIDGLGGTVSSNNKILVVSPSSKDGIDVEYLVAQVVVGEPVVDYSANCGNMTSVVCPFAISQGLVKAVGPWDIAGRAVKKEEMDIFVRIVSVGAVHKASPLTGATAIGGTAFIKGSIMQRYLKDKKLTNSVRIGHPSGVMKVHADYVTTDGEIHFKGIAGQRTARKIMEGYVNIKD